MRRFLIDENISPKYRTQLLTVSVEQSAVDIHKHMFAGEVPFVVGQFIARYC